MNEWKSEDFATFRNYKQGIESIFLYTKRNFKGHFKLLNDDFMNILVLRYVKFINPWLYLVFEIGLSNDKWSNKDRTITASDTEVKSTNFERFDRLLGKML